MRRLSLALLVLPMVSAPVLAEMVTVTPAQIGEMFCISHLGNDDGILRGVLTDELRTQIDYSEARNATIARAFPDEKPPLGDGIPWSSFPDYADSCSIGSIATENGEARVVIQYGFAADPTADYSDTLVLRQVAHPHDPTTGIWRIDDVAYTTVGTLRGTLDGVFAVQ
jgi:hypothetical protein